MIFIESNDFYNCLIISRLQNIDIFRENQPKVGLRGEKWILRACFLSEYTTKCALLYDNLSFKRSVWMFFGLWMNPHEKALFGIKIRIVSPCLVYLFYLSLYEGGYDASKKTYIET